MPFNTTLTLEPLPSLITAPKLWNRLSMSFQSIFATTGSIHADSANDAVALDWLARPVD